MNLKEKLSSQAEQEQVEFTLLELTGDETDEKLLLLELLRETNELNRVLKSYITVAMDKDLIEKMSITSELKEIDQTSQKIQNSMISILKKYQTQSNSYVEKIEQHTQRNENALTNVGKQILTELNQLTPKINQEISRQMNPVKKNISDMSSKLKRDIFLFNWANAFKQGLVTVLLYLLAKFLLSLLAIEI